MARQKPMTDKKQMTASEAYQMVKEAIELGITLQGSRLTLARCRYDDALAALPAMMPKPEEEWQPIDTAPYGKSVLVWWKPKGSNKHAECVAIGERCYVERPHPDEGNGEYKEGCWWVNGRYYEEAHIVAWMNEPLRLAKPGTKITGDLKVKGGEAARLIAAIPDNVMDHIDWGTANQELTSIMEDAAIRKDVEPTVLRVTPQIESLETSPAHTTSEIPDNERLVVYAIAKAFYEIDDDEIEPVWEDLNVQIIAHYLRQAIKIERVIRPYLRTTEPVMVDLEVGAKAIQESLLADKTRLGVMHLEEARACAEAWGLKHEN